MNIKSLTLINFKKFDKYNITFGQINELHGANGVGKTSILDAICVAYYGKLPDGKSEIDRLIKDGESECSIVLEDSKVGIITRNIKGSSSELLLDGQKISQKNFESLYRLVPVEYFLASVNPNYWKELDYKERRSILSDLTPRIDRDKIFVESYPDRLLEKYKILTYKDVNSKIKDVQSTIDSLKGIIQQIKIDIKMGSQDEAIEFDQTRFNELSEKKKLYDSLKPDYDKIQNFKKYNQSLNEYREAKEKLSGLQAKRDSLYSEYPFSKAENKAGNIMTIDDIRGAVEMKDTLIRILAQKESRHELLMENYTNRKKSNDSGICELCGQPIEKNKVHNDIEDKELESIVDEINNVKEKLAQVQLWEEQLIDYDVKLRRIEMSESSLNSLINNQMLKELDSESEKIESIADEVITKYEAIKWSTELESEYDGLYREASKAETLNEYKESNINSQKIMLDENQKLLDKNADDLNDLEILRDALGPKGVESIVQQAKNGYIEAAVGKYVSNIKVETIQQLKTSEGFKEVFNVYKNGIQEKKLSTGNKMILAVGFCLAIQDLLESMFGYKPTILFMDDSSLVTRLDVIKTVAKGTQQFYAINTNDSELNLVIS